jgi:hypothetical protein
MGQFGNFSQKASSTIQRANCDNCEKAAETAHGLLGTGRTCALRRIKQAILIRFCQLPLRHSLNP